MKINASNEYERLQKLSTEQRSVDAVYKVYSVEYKDSNSSSEFREKVNTRNENEGFNESVREAKTTARQYLSPEQIQAWVACSQKGRGELMLSVPPIEERIARRFFNLKIRWIPQPGVGSGELDLSLRGGTIEGKDRFETLFTGPTEFSKIVDVSQNASSVLLSGNIAANTDDIEVGMLKVAQKAFLLDGDSIIGKDGVKIPSRGDESMQYGADSLMDRMDGARGVGPTGTLRTAEWDISRIPPGRYTVAVTYAANEARPLRLVLGNNIVLDPIAEVATGGWYPQNRAERTYGPIAIPSGVKTLRLETRAANKSWPHFRQLRLVSSN